MKYVILFLLPIFLFVSGTAFAEFYKYTDHNGNVRFTDDLGKVPEDQRPEATSYESSKSAIPGPASKKEAEVDQTSAGSGANANTADNSTDEQIKSKKDALSKEYRSLMEEKAGLDAEWNDAKTTIEKHQINLKRSELNKKITRYEEKRKTLNAEIQAHNASMNKDKRKNE